ncbi:hypothetical protein [Culturomica massiliensis]|uniref:hypothetical protein n=1 Tax=Culturomica massiliensis TaxID=1841857 RepID=UPI000837EB21|nr:hypothetical protein [Culturomica massiliensis]
MKKMQKLRLKIIKIKLLYFFAGIIIAIICAILFFNWKFKQSCEEWKKPVNVPISAVWKGGCDGGNWVELVDIKTDTIRFRIYRDWNGDLILDADFVYQNCNDLRLTEANWNEYVSYFDNALEIYSKFQSDSSYCRLIPVYPAYYEEKVE